MDPLRNVEFKKHHAILLSVQRRGFDTSLIVGKSMLDGAVKKEVCNRISLFQTNNLRGFRNPKPSLLPREIVSVTKLLNNIAPDFVFVTGLWVVAPLVVGLYRLGKSISRQDKHVTRFMVYTDVDGREFISGKFKYVWRLMLYLNYLCCDMIMVQTECAKSVVSKYLGSDRKVAIIPVGYSSQIFRPTSYLASVREPIILSVARVTHQKGMDILIKAFAKIHRDFPAWTLRLVGPLDDEGYYSKLLDIIDSEGIKEKVHFSNRVTEERLVAEYLRASVFCLYSNWEGSPASRVEASAMGLPLVISSAGCGDSWKSMGALVGPRGDIEWLAYALSDMMRDEGLRIAASKRLQTHILSWDEVVSRMFSSLGRSHNTVPNEPNSGPSGRAFDDDSRILGG